MTKDIKTLAKLAQAAGAGVAVAQRYYSGELEAEYLNNIKKGDLPYRIVRYQRIIDPSTVNYPVSKFTYVTPETFRKHLKLFRKEFNVVSLQSLIEAIIEKRILPPKTLAITLDGGFVDHLVYALPALHEAELPATIFLPTAFIGHFDFFWHDKVTFVALAAKQSGLKLPIFPFFPESYKEALTQMQGENPQGNMNEIVAFIAALALSPLEDRLAGILTMYKLAEHLGLNYPLEKRFLDWDELRTMERNGLQFASLSHIHDHFADLEVEDVKKDLELAASTLSREFRNPLPALAVPGGMVSKNCLQALRDLNISYVLAADSATAASQVDVSVIRRISLYEENSGRSELVCAHLWDLPL